MVSTRIATLTDQITRPSLAWREAALMEPPSSHQRLLDDAPCLHELECGGSDPANETRKQLRVATWNAERLKFIEASAERLRMVDPDVILMSEVDLGMARSGNRHTVRELAVALGTSYLFGVEFIELALGDEREREWHRGETNEAGLHGGAILSKVPLKSPAILRLEQDGHWFAGTRRGERRIGGRIAMLAAIDWHGTEIQLAAPHLESHSDEAHRALQMQIIFDAMGAEKPAIVAGDLNTKNGLAEPMFARASQAGFEFDRCNDDVPSQRLRPGDPEKELKRLDWFMTRGVDLEEPQTHPATDAAGIAISDHEILTIDLT